MGGSLKIISLTWARDRRRRQSSGAEGWRDQKLEGKSTAFARAEGDFPDALPAQARTVGGGSKDSRVPGGLDRAALRWGRAALAAATPKVLGPPA